MLIGVDDDGPPEFEDAAAAAVVDGEDLDGGVSPATTMHAK